MPKRKCKPTSIRLGEELESDLKERCEELGCSKNDFIKNSVDFMINNESDFDFGLDEEPEHDLHNSKSIISRLDNSDKLEKEIYID